MSKRTAAETDSRRARTKAEKASRQNANAARAAANRTEMEKLNLVPVMVERTRIVPTKDGRTRDITVIKSLSPSKLIRSEKRARARLAAAAANRAAIADIAAASTK